MPQTQTTRSEHLRKQRSVREKHWGVTEHPSGSALLPRPASLIRTESLMTHSQHSNAQHRQVAQQFSVIGLLKPVTSSDLFRCFMLIWCLFWWDFRKEATDRNTFLPKHELFTPDRQCQFPRLWGVLAHWRSYASSSSALWSVLPPHFVSQHSPFLVLGL